MRHHVLNDLRRIVLEKPDKTAFSDGEHALTFRQVYDQSRAVGTALHRRGIYKRPVVVFMRKAPAEIAAFFGVITGGCFYVPIDEEMPAVRIQLILDNVKAPLVICDGDTAEAAKAASFTVLRVPVWRSWVRTAGQPPSKKYTYQPCSSSWGSTSSRKGMMLSASSMI